MIIYDKTRQLLFVCVDKTNIFFFEGGGGGAGGEMTLNLRDSSPLMDP